MTPASATRQTESVEQKFQRLAAVWRTETRFLSSTTKMFSHPAYQEIIALGVEILPSLFRDLEKEPDHWFGVLTTLTGAQPVSSEDRGDLRRMAAAWLRWAKDNGYQW